MEPIIVDGVDVSKCDYYCSSGKCSAERDLYGDLDVECRYDRPNCAHKQLQRELAEKAEIKKFLGISDKSIMQRLEELNERYQDLKIENDKLQTLCDNSKDSLETLADAHNEQVDMIEVLKTKLDISTQALDMILDYLKEINSGLDNADIVCTTVMRTIMNAQQSLEEVE